MSAGLGGFAGPLPLRKKAGRTEKSKRHNEGWKLNVPAEAPSQEGQAGSSPTGDGGGLGTRGGPRAWTLRCIGKGLSPALKVAEARPHPEAAQAEPRTKVSSEAA